METRWGIRILWNEIIHLGNIDALCEVVAKEISCRRKIAVIIRAPGEAPVELGYPDGFSSMMSFRGLLCALLKTGDGLRIIVAVKEIKKVGACLSKMETHTEIRVVYNKVLRLDDIQRLERFVVSQIQKGRKMVVVIRANTEASWRLEGQDKLNSKKLHTSLLQAVKPPGVTRVIVMVREIKNAWVKILWQ